MKVNNYLFGDDSFAITGNHNQKVDLRKELAKDRGGKWAFFDVKKMVIDKSYKI